MTRKESEVLLEQWVLLEVLAGVLVDVLVLINESDREREVGRIKQIRDRVRGELVAKYPLVTEGNDEFPEFLSDK